jgi:hypothetical protein
MQNIIDSARAALRRNRKPASTKEIRNYDHCLVFRRDNRRSVIVADLKLRRLEQKNKRRMANRLPPKTSYAEI